MSDSATLHFRSETSLTIVINNNRFNCIYSKSNNGKYIIACYDGYGVNKGYYFLLKDDELIVVGHAIRPKDGKVGDNGNFIFNDWLLPKEINGTACSFDPHGKIIFENKFMANLHSNSISNNGEFALFQTCNSDNKDGNKLFFYHLKTQTLLWQKTCDFGWPKKYSISEEEKKINLYYDNINTVSLDWYGNIIDKVEKNNPGMKIP